MIHYDERTNRVSRRTVLRTTMASSLTAGSIAVAGCASGGEATDHPDEDGGETDDGAADDPDGEADPPAGSLPSTIEEESYYEAYPDDPTLWRRSADPLDFREGDGRWAAEPTADGAVELRVENDGGVAGFGLEAGRLGDFESATIQAETIETSQDGGEALLWVGAYFDVGGTGDYFEWEPTGDGVETFANFGADAECLAHVPVQDGAATVDADLAWDVVIVPVEAAPDDAAEKGWVVDDEAFDFAMYPADPAAESAGVTLRDFSEGEFDVGGDAIDLGIDGDTRIKLPINVRGNGDGTTEEVVVESVRID